MNKAGMKKIGMVACLVMVICLFSFSTATAGWYVAQIRSINSRTDSGDVIVNLVSATDPPQWDGTARGVLLGNKAGTNRILATMLTAISMGCRIQVQMVNVPSWTAQNIFSATLVAP